MQKADRNFAVCFGDLKDKSALGVLAY